MKKINKFIAGMMVLGMGTGVASALPLQSFQSVSAETKNSFEVKGFKTNLEIGEEVTLPQVAGAELTVIDPSGKKLTLTENKLTATKLGTYTVRYTQTIAGSNGKAIQEYRVVVKGDKPSLKFNSNDSRIIPETTNFEKDIVLPLPSVVDADGEEIANAEVSVQIAKPDHTTIDVTNAQLKAENGYALDVNMEGIYTITYKYVNSFDVIAYKTFKVNAKESYNEANISLVHSLDSTMPSSISLGSKVKLPSVTVKDENNSNNTVSSYYSIKVVNVNSETVYTVDADNSFVPMEEGKYRVTYTINDFFGSKLKGSEDNTYTYTIDNCKDNNDPTPMVVGAYTQTAVGETSKVRVAVDSISEQPYNIVSKFYVTENGANTFTLPAIFGLDDYEVQKVTDNNVEYYEYDTSKVTLIRKLINSKGTTIKTWDSSSSSVNANEAVTFNFNKSEGNYTGSYKIEYTVRDGNGNGKTVTYPFEVIEGLAADQDRSAPTITFDSYKVSHAQAGDVISFKKPTVVDYLDSTAQDKVIGDTRVESHTYYYFNDDVANKVEIKEDAKNADNLAFTLPADLTGKNKVTVITYAKDDHNLETSKSFEIQLAGSNDEVAPSIISGDIVLGGDTYVTGAESSINQHQTVTIADITLTDADENFGASIDVRYFKDANDAVGTKVALTNYKKIYDTANKTITLKNASFEAVNAGTYVVSVIGQDINGNTIVKSTSVKALDVVAPEIVVNWSYTSIDLFETITLPEVDVYDNGELVQNPKVTVEVEGSDFDLIGNSFTAKVTGDYKFKFIAEDNAGNKVESSVFSVHAEDTTAPTITLNEEIRKTVALVQEANSTSYVAVEIPGFTANDASDIDWDYTKVTVTDKNGNDVKVSDSQDGNKFSFVPTGHGSYTVTYTAVDKNGVKTEQPYTILVGDTVAPVITIGNEASNKPGSKKVGDELILDLASVTIYDAIDTNLQPDAEGKKADFTKEGINASVYVYDPNGNPVSKQTKEDGTEYYALESQGQYRIVFNVTDENGVTGSESHSFQVNAKTSGPSISNETMGIILIVASLLLLGGVVAYFFATRKIVRAPKKDKRD